MSFYIYNISISLRNLLTIIALFFFLQINAQEFTILDDFDNEGMINTWFGDDCIYNDNFNNPQINGENPSSKVLLYQDSGGQYANVRFDFTEKLSANTKHEFSLKIYITSSGLTGNQNNQISLKLQNADLNQPWTTQTEIIKDVELDEWQTVTFDFSSNEFINFDNGSPSPSNRSDLNRVLLQVNGENNNDRVIAYIDDIAYKSTVIAKRYFDQLIWSDEFDVDGPLSNEKWFQQKILPAHGSWYNGEIQHYTDRDENAYIENGILKIKAIKEQYTDQGQTKSYTSARLNSKFAFQYGRVEIRARLPYGNGTWPALWLLGKNISENGAYWQTQGFGDTPWPACGEIDIMEHWGNNQNFVQSAIHTPASHGATFNKGGQTISTVSDSFHVYTMEWDETKMVFSVDDQVHYEFNPSIKDEATWPFDAEMYIIMNVAILPYIDPSISEAAMEIDYVRIFQRSEEQPKYCSPDHRFSDQVYFEQTQIDSAKGVIFSSTTNWNGSPQSLAMDIYYPSMNEDDLDERPLIILLPGGDFTFGNRANLRDDCRAFAQRGYVAAAINYRLGWNQSDPENRLNAAYRAHQDVSAAIRFLIEKKSNYKIDENWIIIGGQSAGSETAFHTAYMNQSDWNTLKPHLESVYGSLHSNGNNFNHYFSISTLYNSWGRALTSGINNSELIPTISFHDINDPVISIYDDVNGYSGTASIHDNLSSIGVCNIFISDAEGKHGIYNPNTIEGDLFRTQHVSCFIKSLMCNECPNTMITDSITSTCNYLEDHISNMHVSEHDIEILSDSTNNEYIITGALSKYIIEIRNTDDIIYKTIKSTNNIHRINKNFFPSGIYLVHIKNENNELLSVKKIIRD